MRSVFLSLLVLSAALWAQNQPQNRPQTTPQTTPKPSQPRIVTATRLVALFSGIERSLLAAAEQHDEQKLDQLLKDDFDVTVAGQPDPIPRDEWLKQPVNATNASFRQLAVRATDDGAIVSFVTVEGSGGSAQAQFVVDYWSHEDAGEWKLLARYVAASPVPSAPAGRKPTGKE